MLILTRQVGESIFVNEDIKVTVVRINGGQVGIGIEAPEEFPIHREEIHKRILAERHGNAPKGNRKYDRNG